MHFIDPSDFKMFSSMTMLTIARPAESQVGFRPFAIPSSRAHISFTGAAAFMGLGAYSYFSGHSQLKAQQAKILQSKSMFGMRSRQAGITGSALVLAGMGFWRLVN
ncbi:hypothetical protein ONS95_003167 [Cadophora gregata]|uniref:uncharacterized protein n=1 Tax=Cadophora gregata TaxID=51156 RepID=UPI0026DB1AF6|nr:uncharacterized protein ONS95_003167 [Cadophora gregata]KAK0108353.1 hypothetical protein ONS95_003167 [Cadophora gregata]